MDNRGPVLTDKTTLREMITLGAGRLSDISMTELLEYVRNQCLQVCADRQACEEMGWEGDFAAAAAACQEALDWINHALIGDFPTKD